jgi:hypothetical protein
MKVAHLNAGARGASRLVLDDRDRFRLLRGVVAAFGDALLAYCLMDTHLHVVVEGGEESGEVLGRVLRGYARAFNARHRAEGPLLRGPVVAIPAPGVVELARMLRYVHENPIRMREPIVAREVDYEWSSARAFAGLARTAFPNVARAEALGGVRHRRVQVLAGLEAVPVPGAGPELILAAAAQAFGVDPLDLAARRNTPALVAARRVYVTLGRLESYRDSQLALVLGRTRVRVTQLAAEPVDLEGARIARTLLREPRFRVRLRAPALLHR